MIILTKVTPSISVFSRSQTPTAALRHASGRRKAWAARGVDLGSARRAMGVLFGSVGCGWHSFLRRRIRHEHQGSYPAGADRGGGRRQAADLLLQRTTGVPREDVSDEAEPPKYDFAFGVKDGYSGADFAHQEARDEDETRGSYYVQLPDGRLQKVTYYVDGDGGYVAEVSYEGEAQYPESQESQEAPVYAPPRPSYGYPQ
nr:cuticle protein 18.6-like [Penaeus vannamei]